MSPSNPTPTRRVVLLALVAGGSVQAQSGQRRAAVDTLQALLQVQPGEGRNWFNYAFILDELGELQRAEAAFRRATELSPQLDRAWYGLGLALIRLQRLDEAIAALKRNTQLQPMSPYGWYQLARVQFDRQEREETRRIIRHLKGFEPKVAAQLERETGLAA
mgnify:CR=1 FL=1